MAAMNDYNTFYTSSDGTISFDMNAILRRNEKVSLFNTSDGTYLKTKFGLIKNDEAIQEVYSDYRNHIENCRMKMHELDQQRDAFILACVKCLNDSVSTTFTAKDAHAVACGFSKRGFEDSNVVKFLEDVKETFFKDLIIDKGEDAMNDIECIGMSSDSGNSYSPFTSEHFTVKFKCKSRNRPFGIAIPVKENSTFYDNSFEDSYRGRFLLYGLHKVALGLGTTECLTAHFSPESLNKDVKTYLTTDKLDSACVWNVRTYDTRFGFGTHRFWSW